MDEGRIEAIEFLLAWVIANTRPSELLEKDFEHDLFGSMNEVSSPMLGHYERILKISLTLQAASKQALTLEQAKRELGGN